jgi:hypothetical protein
MKASINAANDFGHSAFSADFSSLLTVHCSPGAFHFFSPPFRRSSNLSFFFRVPFNPENKFPEVRPTDPNANSH